MPRTLSPDPDKQVRRDVARRLRIQAAEYAYRRSGGPLEQVNNRESTDLQPPVGTFTKGLPHDDFGIVDGAAIDRFIHEINQPLAASQLDESPFPGTHTSRQPAPFDVPKACALGAGDPNPCSSFKLPTKPDGSLIRGRSWESPLAGHTYDLEGPDADGVRMPPAPRVGSDELVAEMAELQAMALLRDVPFNDMEAGQGGSSVDAATTQAVIDTLNALPWFADMAGQPSGSGPNGTLTDREQARREARFVHADRKVTKASLFRGSPIGAKAGPYLSQFLLIGNAARSRPAPAVAAALNPTDATTRPNEFVPQGLLRLSRGAAAAGAIAQADVTDGFIQYGAQTVNQRLVPQRAGVDYMSDWASWLDVQNGADRRNMDAFEQGIPDLGRFLHTPRDLITYVHFDALYQAYLNACLILLGLRAFTDRGLPEGTDHPTRGGFATFGDPHILTLVTEVATRTLKAVRRQKYQTHLRARPEALAGSLTLGAHDPSKLGSAQAGVERMLAELGKTQLPDWIGLRNKQVNAGLPDERKSWITEEINQLLPMAFPEGSPMHPSYGAGHASVAGACATVLKAYFEMYAIDDARYPRGRTKLDAFIGAPPQDLFGTPLLLDHAFVQAQDSPIKGTYRTADLTVDGQNFPGGKLELVQGSAALPIQDEIDKLATNIAIARNMAGVHYYTDYYESLRLGERIAVGVLQEQMLTYREPVSMRFRSFDGDHVMITGSGGSRGFDDALVHVWAGGTHQPIDTVEWWNRAILQADP